MNLYKLLKFGFISILILNIISNILNIFKNGEGIGIYTIIVSVILLNITLVSVQGTICDILLMFLNKLGFNSGISFDRKLTIILIGLVVYGLYGLKLVFLNFNMIVMFILISFKYELTLVLVLILFSINRFLNYKREMMEVKNVKEI